MGTWGISPFMLKVRVGECVDTQVDQGVNGRHPSSHLPTPGAEKRGKSSEQHERQENRGINKTSSLKMIKPGILLSERILK